MGHVAKVEEIQEAHLAAKDASMSDAVNYYIMEREGKTDKVAIISKYPSLKPPLDNWMGGSRFDVNVPEPLVFEIHPENQGEMCSMMSTRFLLMKVSLISVLEQSGVDNLDVYDAIIKETGTGMVYDDYKVVNLIGVVRAADMSKSDARHFGISDDGVMNNFFRKLELDEEKIHGLKMFRLMESLDAIVVGKEIKENIDLSEIDDLVFYEPSDWPG